MQATSRRSIFFEPKFRRVSVVDEIYFWIHLYQMRSMISKLAFYVQILWYSYSNLNIFSAPDVLERNATTNLFLAALDRQLSPKIVEAMQHHRPMNDECGIKSGNIMKFCQFMMILTRDVCMSQFTGTCLIFSPSLSLVYSIIWRFDTRISHEAEWSQSNGILQSTPNVASMYDLSSFGISVNGTSGINLLKLWMYISKTFVVWRASDGYVL